MDLANHRPPATTAGAATTCGARIDQALARTSGAPLREGNRLELLVRKLRPVATMTIGFCVRCSASYQQRTSQSRLERKMMVSRIVAITSATMKPSRETTWRPM